MCRQLDCLRASYNWLIVLLDKGVLSGVFDQKLITGNYSRASQSMNVLALSKSYLLCSQQSALRYEVCVTDQRSTQRAIHRARSQILLVTHDNSKAEEV